MKRPAPDGADAVPKVPVGPTPPPHPFDCDTAFAQARALLHTNKRLHRLEQEHRAAPQRPRTPPPITGRVADLSERMLDLLADEMEYIDKHHAEGRTAFRRECVSGRLRLASAHRVLHEFVLCKTLSLNPEQLDTCLRLHRLVTQPQYDPTSSGRCALMTGEAGSGKSYCVAALQRLFRWSRVAHSVTAMTGAAATQLQGATFHSFLGIGQKPLTADDMDRRLRSMRRWKPDVYERLRETRAVFVDECSMMTPAFLFQADYILSRVRDQLSVPFGGMTIIFVGDFAQLPPVDSEANHQVKFIFETHLWHSAVHDRLFLLRSNHRQALDPLFAQVCSEIRVGKLTETGRALLQSRVLSERIDLDRLLGKRLFIATRNDTVSTMNERYLGGLDGQELTFRAQVYRQPLPREMHKEIDQQQLPMDSDIRIRVGSTVMLLVNRDVANGLVNGAMGTVVGGTVNANLQIRFHQSDLVHEIPYHSWSFRQGTEWVIYSQIPVRLAAAITAHKSQGMTVNSAVIVGAPRMQPAMFYVMMSRVRSRTGLFLTEFKDAWIHVPPAVLTFIDKVKSNVCRSIA